MNNTVMNNTVMNNNNYTYNPGDEIIIKTTLINTHYDNKMHLLFPNHTIKCTIKKHYDCYLYLNDNIVFLETILSPLSKLKNNIARDKMFSVNPIKDIYVKYKNNLYFNVTIHKINLELLNDIKKYIFVPSLYSSCFYALYTSELLKIQTYYMLQ